MSEPVSVLSAWESFYVIVGSSGAALTGLMFVVITLIADTPQRQSSNEIDAFGTPTIVHFCSVLLVAAAISAPWRELRNVGLTMGALGIGGMAYVLIVLRRAHRQTGYKPVLEDWIWHTIIPFLAYLIFLVAGSLMMIRPESALFGIGASTLLLLFTGIHNSWDTVTYIATEMRRQAGRDTTAEPAAPLASKPPPPAPSPPPPPPVAAR